MLDFTKKDLFPGAEGIFLEVADNNHAALSLYRSYGFVELAHQKGYYSSGEGAFRMLLSF